jgi:ankyrin repeat protein
VIEHGSHEGYEYVALKMMSNCDNIDYCGGDNYPIRCASRRGMLKLVEKLLTIPEIDVNSRGGQALYEAAKYNHVEIARLLMNDPRIDYENCGKYVFACAIQNGNIEMTEYLYSKLNNETIFNAFKEEISSVAADGCMEMMSLMIAFKELPIFHYHNAAVLAAKYGKTLIVKNLLDYTDLLTNARRANYVLVTAAKYKHNEVLFSMVHKLRHSKTPTISMSIIDDDVWEYISTPESEREKSHMRNSKMYPIY